MSDQIPFSPPPGWTTTSISDKRIRFTNKSKGLDAIITTVFRTANFSKYNKEPKYYTVQVQQDWFAKGTLGDREMVAKVDTWDEALSVAQEFMNEFSREVESISSDEVQATHAAVGDHDMAESMLTTQASAEALADAAGYSDELLLSVLDTETNGQYLLVAHRDGNTITTVYGDDSVFGEDWGLSAVHAVFPIDNDSLNQILNNEKEPIATVVHIGDHSLYRFMFGTAHETDVVLPHGTQITSAEFENTILNVLEEKWCMSMHHST